MNSKNLELTTTKEKEIAQKYREASMKIDNNIKEFVSILSDYAVYNLFAIINEDSAIYYNRWQEAIKNNRKQIERCEYRKKVYHLLKDSGYNDGYVEEHIEKLTDILISFYTSPQKISYFHNLYNKEEHNKKLSSNNINHTSLKENNYLNKRLIKTRCINN